MKVAVDKKFKTGLDWMDEQHGELIRSLRSLMDSIEKGTIDNNDNKIGELFDFLSSYVIEHFAFEADYMEKFAYPERKDHLAEHSYFAYLLSVLKKEYSDNGTSNYIAVKLKRVLLDWLVNHVGGMDKNLALFLIDIKNKEAKKARKQIINLSVN